MDYPCKVYVMNEDGYETKTLNTPENYEQLKESVRCKNAQSNKSCEIVNSNGYVIFSVGC